MRLFVAIDLEPAIVERLAAALEGYRAVAPAARWTRLESLHLTLKFIGHVAPEREKEIAGALSEVRQAPLQLRFAGTGMFPTPRQPRVFWAGVDSSNELTRLAQQIDDALHRLGFELELRPFSPHLTLARAARAPSDLKPLSASLAAREPLWGDQTAREFFLYQSHPGRGGSRYEKLRRFALDAPPPAGSAPGEQLA